MAECVYCEQEMTTAATCIVAVLHQDGEPIVLTPFRGSRRRGANVSDRCGDCGVKPGGFHHLGCDLQRCPLCRRQFITCDCVFDEDGPPDVPLHLTMAPGTPISDAFDDAPVDRFFDDNGDAAERRWLNGQEVIIHYTDLPECDRAVVRGVPCTSPLRTIIDLAPNLTEDRLHAMVRDALEREMFTLDEAWSRLADDDMQARPGALRLRDVLPAFE